MVNYGLIFLVVSFLLVPKIREVLSTRKKTIKENIVEAEHLRAQLSNLVKEAEEEKNALIKSLEDERNAAHKDIESKKQALMAVIDEEKNKILSDANKQIKEQQRTLIADTEKKILSMVETIIFKTLSRDVPEDAIKKSIESSWNSQKEQL
jgi:F0F1-type ATP synthase membrane subunit b/b'